MARWEERSFEIDVPSEIVHTQARQVLESLGYVITSDDRDSGRLEANNSFTVLLQSYRIVIVTQPASGRQTSVTITCEFASKGYSFDLTGERRKRIDQVEKTLRALLRTRTIEDPEIENVEVIENHFNEDRRFERRKLYSFILEHFDREEIEELIFNLGIDSNQIDGQNGQEMARELVEYSERNRLIPLLKAAFKEARPILYAEHFGSD